MVETPGTHSARAFLQELAAQQAAGRRHVAVLIGAGASRAAGVPDLAGLGRAVRDALGVTHPDAIGAVFTGALNLEQALSRLRRLALVLGPGDALGPLDLQRVIELERAVTASIIKSISGAAVNDETYRGLAHWAMRQQRSQPVEIFTLNYDLLIERSLEAAGAVYFDGFVGSLKAVFHADLVESRKEGSTPGIPSSFVRLWKLHGSANWLRQRDGDDERVLRLGAHVAEGEVAAIYPSEEKYVAARRVPFLVLHDRFRRALSEPETLLLISGYAFGDDHLNEVIYDAASRNSRSAFMVFCHETIPEDVRGRALYLPNLVVVSPEEAIIAAVPGPWAPEGEISGAFEKGRLLLGDFTNLSRYLATLTPGGFSDPG